MVRQSLALAFLSVVVLSPAWIPLVAQEQKKGQSLDQHFVLTASEADLAEINLGRLASQRASNKDVKEFGQKMVEDHGKSSKELLAIVNKKGIKAATQMSKKHEAAMAELSRLQGAEFDKHYMKHMVMGHGHAVKLFEDESNNGSDADIKAFASKTLPVIQEHHRMAKSIADKVQSGGSDTNKTTGSKQ